LLTPSEIVEIWFQQHLGTGTMISGTPPNAVEIDLINLNPATRRYRNGRWSAAWPTSP
jgi:hypothetical protein